MVVVSHAAAYFHFLNTPFILNLPLGQGVSFFFVLSGFILTYNYPKLSGRTEILRFWRARFARIWPAHAVILFICLFVFPPAWGVPPIVNIAAHALLVHGWILRDRFFFSINPPSWSISTELAFYLLFPILLWEQKKNWWAKLLLAALVVVGFVWFGAGAQLPDSGKCSGLTVKGLMYINPLVRVFEFVLGMTCATLWAKIKDKQISPKLLTVLEVGCITLIVAYVANIFNLVEPLKASAPGRVVRCWLLYEGNCFGFAALIFVCALQKGFVSRLLSNRICVWLGEISYSIYLIHMMLLVLYGRNIHFAAAINSPIMFAGYGIALIGAAHLTYTFVEKPMRKWLAPSATFS